MEEIVHDLLFQNSFGRNKENHKNINKDKQSPRQDSKPGLLECKQCLTALIPKIVLNKKIF
jgi:hypothetical protein